MDFDRSASSGGGVGGYDYDYDYDEAPSAGQELVSGGSRRESEGGWQFVASGTSTRDGPLRLARQLYPQRAKEVSSMYRNICLSTGKNHRGVRRRAYIAACVLYVSVKENTAYLPTAFRELLDKADVTATQLLRAIQSMMTMGVRWSVPVDFHSMVVRPAVEHGFRIQQHMELPESGKPHETAAAFYLCTSASLTDTADLFGVDLRQLNRALSGGERRRGRTQDDDDDDDDDAVGATERQQVRALRGWEKKEKKR